MKQGLGQSSAIFQLLCLAISLLVETWLETNGDTQQLAKLWQEFGNKKMWRCVWGPQEPLLINEQCALDSRVTGQAGGMAPLQDSEIEVLWDVQVIIQAGRQSWGVLEGYHDVMLDVQRGSRGRLKSTSHSGSLDHLEKASASLFIKPDHKDSEESPLSLVGTEAFGHVQVL